MIFLPRHATLGTEILIHATVGFTWAEDEPGRAPGWYIAERIAGGWILVERQGIAVCLPKA